MENAVRIIYTRIYAKLRDTIYFTLEELNAAILLALGEHNSLLLTGRNYSRIQQFEEIERAALAPLPPLRYELKKQIFVTVMKNGHVSLNADKHYYSVPYRYIGKKIKLIYSRHTVDIFYHYERIAQHKRMKSPYNYVQSLAYCLMVQRYVHVKTNTNFQVSRELIHVTFSFSEAGCSRSLNWQRSHAYRSFMDESSPDSRLHFLNKTDLGSKHLLGHVAISFSEKACALNRTHLHVCRIKIDWSRLIEGRV